MQTLSAKGQLIKNMLNLIILIVLVLQLTCYNLIYHIRVEQSCGIA